MTTKLKKYDDDDGRIICNMDVEGMRWNGNKAHRNEKEKHNASRGEQMTRSEARRFTWYSVLAGLLIASVFSVTWVLFILFCVYVWFR